MSELITRNEWVSTITGEVVEEEWHSVLAALEANYPSTYDNPQDEIDRPYLLKDDIAWGTSETMFDAGQEMGAVSANNNNSPNFYNWYGGRVRTRPVYVQVEFSYRSTLEGSNTDLLTNKQGIFNRTKRKLEAIMTSNPRRLQNKGITWIERNPTIIQDGRAFTNFGMVGTLTACVSGNTAGQLQVAIHCPV